MTDRGASLVEAALVVPFVVLLLMGVVDLARVLLAEIALNNAVSEGAIFAAQFPDDHTKTQQRVVDAGSDVGLATSDVVVTCPMIPPVTGNEHIKVEAFFDVEMVTPIGRWFGTSITLDAESTAVNTQVDTASCDPSP